MAHTRDSDMGRHKFYSTTWRNKYLTADAENIDDMISSLKAAAAQLEAMKAAGVELDYDGGQTDDYATLLTEDPEVAKKFGMEPYDV